MNTVSVTPVSRKAKNRFANLMNHDPLCIVEQRESNRVFLSSMNKVYFFWVELDNDPNWMLH